MVQGIEEGGSTTHGRAGYGTAAPLRAAAVGLLNIGYELLEEEILKIKIVVRIVEIAHASGSKVGVGSDYNHGSHFTACDATVHESLQHAVVDPSLLVGQCAFRACRM